MKSRDAKAAAKAKKALDLLKKRHKDSSEDEVFEETIRWLVDKFNSDSFFTSPEEKLFRQSFNNLYFNA